MFRRLCMRCQEVPNELLASTGPLSHTPWQNGNCILFANAFNGLSGTKSVRDHSGTPHSEHFEIFSSDDLPTSDHVHSRPCIV